MDRPERREASGARDACLRTLRNWLKQNGMMRISGMGMGKRAKAVLASTVLAATALFAAAPAWAQELVGQPTPGGLGLQPAAAPLMHDVHIFHNAVLMPAITVVCLLVLVLLMWIVFRYNKRRNPVPARWSHNTVIEVIWTIVPVLILIVIAVFSFRLLFDYHDIPEPDVTVKVTGNQWSWTYEYPDHGIGEYVSNMIPEAEARAQGLPYLLAADEPMVVPMGQNVQLLITASDVIHSLALPAFGLKTDAVPGRVNETWFRADRVGVFYGQCSELCGVDHAFMPIQINVVTQAEFEAWVAERGGALPGAETAEDTAVEASASVAEAPEAATTETEDAPAADAAPAVQ